MQIAFFDMDKTLLSKSSGTLYVKYLARRNQISAREFANVMFVAAQYRLNVLNFAKAMARLSTFIKDGDAAASKRLCDTWVQEDVLQYVAPKALARLREHEARGDYVLLLSASTQFAVEPVARQLSIPYRCTELEIVDGKFTGNIVGESCYAEGKAYWGKRIASERDVLLSDCIFYTDSYSDRALMDIVGHPIAVNPDRQLLAYAQVKGWPVEMFY